MNYLFKILTSCYSSFFFFNDPATPEIYPFSLPDALPISRPLVRDRMSFRRPPRYGARECRSAARSIRRMYRPSATGRHWRGSVPADSCRSRERQNRSEEHTSELQSPCNLVCRLLLEKKKQ